MFWQLHNVNYPIINNCDVWCTVCVINPTFYSSGHCNWSSAKVPEECWYTERYCKDEGKRWTRWGTLYKGRPRSSRSPCTIKWRGSPQGGGKAIVQVSQVPHWCMEGGLVEHGIHKREEQQTTSFSLRSCGKKNWQSCKIKSGSGLEMRLCMSQFDKST